MIKPGVTGPQRQSSRLAKAPRLAVLQAMPAPLAPSPPGRASRLELQSAPGVEGGAASARRRWAGTGRVLALLLSAAARQLQLTSPKFPAPAPLRPFRCARFVVCARVCAEPGAPLSEFLRTKPSRRGGEGARGGNLRKPRSHLTSRVLAGAAPASPTPAAQWAPSGPGCHSAAPEVAGALLPGSGECCYLLVQASAAGSGCACPAAAESVYIWALAEEVELRTPGGRRDQRSLFAPTPLGTRIKQDPHRPPPPFILLLPPLFT